MLDTETKRRIDNARDILVGKVPDPKAQVEQITTALIYKFMDDMDKESIELGGKATFFSNGFEDYSWSKILSNTISGFDRLNMYSDSIQKMSLNKNLPQLFRDMFKGAFLPYKDTETLNLFLKEIDGFTYDHSERLGDAFEYLLSVLGSQGDAGQFRTPRHIIDFIVRVVNPTKNETILDPACGTAGFLISAYKHITNSNKEKPLTPDEKATLTNNFTGYDISPDMVKLSLVNMYLHNFPNPKIQEYDTLTSETKWDDTFDVVLANPPFMSPKGGIRPHQRFTVKAKRSEVLFVDYIAEHLNIGGRAGIIVPEGIIFQSQNSYKELRKMLVEKHLYAVVSLPAGAFNPYSGVKTSILLMDKTIAKKSDNILFIKIENDGFGLGAQRRAFDKDDLPLAEEIIKEYLNTFRSKECNSELVSETLKQKFGKSSIWSIATKDKIAESGDYNLSGERYKTSLFNNHSEYGTSPIGDVCELINGRAFKPSDWEKKESGGLPIIRIQNLNNPKAEFNYYVGEVNQKVIVENGQLLFSWSGSRGTSFGAHIWNGSKAILNQHIFKVMFNERLVTKNFLYYALNEAVAEVEENLHGGVGLVHITKGNLEKIQIPLPPLEIQKEIVEEIEGYQKEIDEMKESIKEKEQKIKDRIARVWGE